MGISVIHWDLDRVLWNPDEFLPQTLPDCIRKGVEKGLQGNEEELLRDLYKIREEYGSNYKHHFDKLVEHYNGEQDPKIINAMKREYHDSKASNMKPARNILNVLKLTERAGYINTAVSNGVYKKQEDKLCDLNLMPFFEIEELYPKVFVKDQLVAIGEGETEKPNPATWEEVRGKINKYFGEISREVHIGDRYRQDVYGANCLGIFSIKVDVGKHAEETLEDVIDKKGIDPSLKELYIPDYRIEDIREVPAALKYIMDNEQSIKKRKYVQPGNMLYNSCL